MILYYTSSNGEVFNLKAGKLRTRTANYHTYEWSPQAVSQQYGEKVYRFDKSASVYSTTISVFGSLADRRQQLNRLHNAFNTDIYNMTPGRIMHGAYYIECYITVSSTYPENPYTQNELNIYCPYPFWMRDSTYKFLPVEEPEYPYLDYTYDYQYDYKAKLPGKGIIENPGERGANFTLTIYGATTDPKIVLNGIEVGAVTSLGSAEELVVDTRDKTVKKYGLIEKNFFNSRIKGPVSMFTQLPPGVFSVHWNGEFAFDLVVHEERSEPLWI